MDIQQAKEQIKHSIQIYLQKDNHGIYQIPVEKQRPVFLLGAPGIGKTAIMEQIAHETGLPLVAYSMTHHTRQSALGLPIIVEREYQGKHFSVSEYTLSEIIASLYQCMERTGKREGILFLDEINCVSETLAPSMLQFLQYKTFGNHQIPDGWVLVTAGNPPQYNRSARTFDLVTLDRLKVMEIEPDFDTWQRYARETNIHRAIQSYLDIRRDDFYRIDSGRQGQEYVTARGWEDLSEAMKRYEQNGFPVDLALMTQYIRHNRVAEEFCTWYQLYCKYREAYPVRDILAGQASVQVLSRARAAGLDERVTLLELSLEALLPVCQNVMEEEQTLRQLQTILRVIRNNDTTWQEQLNAQISLIDRNLDAGLAAGTLNRHDGRVLEAVRQFLKQEKQTLQGGEVKMQEDSFDSMKRKYEEKVENHKENIRLLSEQLSGLFAFVQKAWGDGHEMLILVTELTANQDSMAFLYTFGNPDYEHYSQLLELTGRRDSLIRETEKLLRQEGAESIHES